MEMVFFKVEAIVLSRGSNGMLQTGIEKAYGERYSNSEAFRDVYKFGRKILYKRILTLLKSLGVRSAVDIGCSFGLLVDVLNENSIEAHGVDLPIPELREFHETLLHSENRFVYGSINDVSTIQKVVEIKSDAVILLDTLRFIEGLENLKLIRSQYVIVKEVSSRCLVGRPKKGRGFPFVALLSPQKCRDVFLNYEIEWIYPSRFLLGVNRPLGLISAAINYISPTYCMILKKK